MDNLTEQERQMIAAMAQAMGTADRVWYWKDGYPEGERLREFYEAAALRQYAAHRVMLAYRGS